MEQVCEDAQGSSPTSTELDTASPTFSVESPNRRLSLRATFIDVVDEDPEEEQVQVTRSKRRVKTAPSMSIVNSDNSDKFSEERAYVENLSEKMAQLSFGVQRTTQEFFEADALEPCYIQTTSSQDPRLGLGGSMVADPARLQHMEHIISRSAVGPPPPGFGAPMTTAVTAQTLSSQRAAGGAGFSPPHRAPKKPGLSAHIEEEGSGSDGPEEDTDQVAHNTGSVGHPELCNRPCLFFAAGTCTSLDTCDFCHLPHKKRLAHLDKRHRDMLHELTMDRWCTLVLPMLRQRAGAIDASPTTQALLNQICFACGGAYDEATPEHRNTPWINRNERTVFLKLRSMTLRSLMATVERSLEQRKVEVHGAVELLLNHLRGVLAR